VTLIFIRDDGHKFGFSCIYPDDSIEEVKAAFEENLIEASMQLLGHCVKQHNEQEAKGEEIPEQQERALIVATKIILMAYEAQKAEREKAKG